MKENVIIQKTYDFSLRIVKLFRYLTENYRIYALANQVLRSGTSIGANTEEAMGGFSKKKFRHSLTIAYHEARETRYWIRLLRDSEYITETMASSLLNDLEEIIKILGKILITMKRKAI